MIKVCVGVPEIIPVELSKYKEVGKSGAIAKIPSVGVIFWFQEYNLYLRFYKYKRRITIVCY
ncbi:hypothetical protein LEP1GSC170_1606 [Leptospira interrogans serovar Bataviae str. HAI135]|nr:hypothetical protein LEP1GSC170_1606 [Leptospira interrogans serovar Bataviae str. HAI135]